MTNTLGKKESEDMREKEIAIKLMKKFETRNPFKICEQFGILVKYDALNGPLGFYQRVLGSDVICIDVNQPAHIAYYICAHELYHALEHSGQNRMYLERRTLQIPGKFEKSADRFAAYFLYPYDEELIEYVDYSLKRLSCITGLPEDLVKWRYDQIERGRFQDEWE